MESEVLHFLVFLGELCELGWLCSVSALWGGHLYGNRAYLGTVRDFRVVLAIDV